MKYLNLVISIILLLLCSIQITAQNNNSGKIVYKSYYPDKKQRNRSVDMTVYFNSYESLLADIEQFKKTVTNTEKVADGISLTLPYGDSIGGRIYRNIKDRVMVTRRPYNSISDAFIVKENWVDIDWKILNKTKQIGNYKTTMAKGSFRGRNYTAWFTYDIPVPFGPWKLHGLPGLILEAEDSEKMMRFYAIEIKIPFEVQEIIKVPTAENEITLKEEVYMQDNFTELLVKKINARRPKGMLPAIPGPNTDGRKYRTEKIYEWEIDAPDDKKK